ncbi:dihydroorotase-like protein [Pseudonocardia sulfidoxydans NBRC 16205]|uniref:Dihydroorotase-like protein n=1 Tax=Pseudonocardia sulfidoxydans NBRC 16205 TaxID=1223511 RepID=A0A511DKR1_9PSEU|nr:amidohydrolase family protein [Pseudonocardia sulfidoxydans]GEL25386.1 dihydroorotase-like protein [Pseudonocardia sulfidoxydans NBRC 16205]
MSEVHDLRLVGGRVFQHGAGLQDLDILVTDGVVSGLVARGATVAAASEVDITGKVVLPGGIDPHVHLGKDIRVPRDPEDGERETASAVAGGITSMLIYLMSADPYEKVFAESDAAMAGNSHTDYGFHFVLGTDDQVASIPDYVRELGVPSFKFFMNFRGDEGRYLGLPGNDDAYMYNLLGKAADAGALVCPHPENIELVWKLREQPRDETLPPLEAWYRSRPPVVEAEAVQRVAYFASQTGASVYAVHTSSKAALDAMAMQQTAYPNLFTETCTQYLTLTTDADCGTYGKVNPPVRHTEDVEALWEGLRTGKVDTVGSDHNSRHRTAKEKDIWTASAGFPGTGLILPTTIGLGLARGIDLERLVEATSTRAAQLFGLFPRKGTIRVGSDADLAVLDLDTPMTVRAETQHSVAEYSPWEGAELPCSVVHTIVRGKFAVRDGQLASVPGGTYLSRINGGAAALASQKELV